jgi:hypothetical protein
MRGVKDLLFLPQNTPQNKKDSPEPPKAVPINPPG